MQIDQGTKSYERVEYIDEGDSNAGSAQYNTAQSPSYFSPERIIRLVLQIGLFVAACLVLLHFYGLVFYLIAGSLIAYLVRPLVERLEGVGIPKVPAILITFVSVLGLITILVTSLVPFLASQVAEVTQQITEEKVVGWADAVEGELRSRIPIIQEGEVKEVVRNVSSTLFQEQQFADMVGSLVAVFTDIFYAILVIPFVTFFFLRDAAKIRRAALQLVPNRYFEVTLSVIEKIETTIGRYLRGLLLQSTSVAIVATICLSFTDIKYALIVGVFTGIANSIPYFGPFMGLTAGSLIAIAQTGDLTLIPGVLIAMAITQIADNLFFQPFIFSRAAQTHPLIILFVVLIGAQIGGIVGMLLAIPLMTTIWVTIKHTLWSLRNYRILHAS